MTLGFDIETLKIELETLLKKHSITADISQDKHRRGTIYMITTPEATMAFTIGSEWIGYELEVSRAVFGKEIRIFSDTDNYSLGGKNENISKEIFNEALLYVQALVDGNIYVGKLNNTPTVILPQVGVDTYKLVQKKRFSYREEVIEKDQLQNIVDLRALKH